MDQINLKSELTLRKNPKNQLENYRKLCDIDTDFFQKFWLQIDPFNHTSSKDLETFNKYNQIILDAPHIFLQQSEIEEDRETQRIITHRQTVHYFNGSKLIQPISEVLSNVNKFIQFVNPIAALHYDTGVKFTVGLSLAYKTIENLGTDQQNSWKKRIENGDDTGCFALTELGHGSNAKGILTTATYDHESNEFIVNTPCKEAMKFWIGGAAKTATMCVCFAQLIVNEQNQGPHAFIIPLRDKNSHMPLTGITIGDCGKKQGYDGIDNGFIIFDNIRIPKSNFLNRISEINENGVFSSHIKSADKRFGLSLAGLSNGRMCLVQSMITQMNKAIKIAIRFAALRKQFGNPKQKDEQNLLEYRMHQYRLFPFIGYAFSFRNCLMHVTQTWVKYQTKIFQENNQNLAEIHALLSVLKVQASWKAYQGILESRRSCGGLGYSYYSQLACLLADNDINSTWEGDNNVLLQQTAKYLLESYKMKINDKQVQTVTCNWIKIDDVLEEKCLYNSIEELMSPKNLIQIFEYRCNKLLQRCSMQISKRIFEKKEDSFDIWNDEQVFGAQDLALAYGELCQVIFDASFLKKFELREKKDFIILKNDTKEICINLFRLSTLMKIQSDIGTWYENGYLTSDQGEMIRNEIKNILKNMKKFAVSVVDTMLPCDELLNSMIAPSDGDLYKSIQKKLYSSPGVFQRIKNWQEIVYMNQKPKL